MIFINANLLTMDSNAIPSGFLRVKDGKIQDLGPMDKLGYDEESVDLAGKTILPGFIDAHSHLGLYEDGLGFEGDDLNEDTDPVTPQIRASDGINPFDRAFTDAIKSGITCAVVSPGSANPIAGQICAIKTSGRWIEKMLVKDPLAMKFALGENPKMTYSNKSQMPATRMAVVALIREQLYRAKRYLSDKENAENDSDIDAPDYDAKLEALIPVLKREIKAHFHAHKAYDIMSAIRIAREFSLDYTLIHCTEGHLIADILAENNAKAVLGPLICARTKPELVNLSAQNCATMHTAGVEIAISTDYPEIPADFLANSAALAVANGLPVQKALMAITIDAARTVGLDKRLGSLTKGKDADFLVFSGDPLAIGNKPEMVFINGSNVL